MTKTNCDPDRVASCAESFGEIKGRLSASEENFDKFRSGFWHEVKALRADIADVKKLIVGNGQPGLVGRIDRLEQARSQKWNWIVFVAIPLLALAAMITFEWLKLSR